MLTHFQNAYVRLAAHRGFRQAFADDPQTALAPYNLSPREIEALRGIPKDALKRYAEGLLNKRSREFSRAVPLTLRVCPSLERRYRRWLASHPAPRADNVLPPGLREALRVLEPLRRELDLDPGEAIYAGDLLAFEVLAGASEIDGLERSFKARFRADEILAELRRGGLPIDPSPASTEYRLTAAETFRRTPKR